MDGFHFTVSVAKQKSDNASVSAFLLALLQNTTLRPCSSERTLSEDSAQWFPSFSPTTKADRLNQPLERGITPRSAHLHASNIRELHRIQNA